MFDNKIVYLPGIKPVLEALVKNPDKIIEIYLKANLKSRDAEDAKRLCEANKIPLKLVDNSVLDKLCRSRSVSAVNHQGVVAKIKAGNIVSLDKLLRYVYEAPLPLILALDQIQDPGNLGTLSRTAYALGCAGLILPLHNGALLSPGASRSSAGALDLLPCAEVVNLARSLDEAAERDFNIYATDSASNGAIDAFSVSWATPAILVLGNENKGVRPGVLKRCQYRVKIPFRRDFDSLNIAQAGAIFIGLFSSTYK
ncbi:MAG: RNA methyltransferase [Desulfovibrio sp.]|nr:RNA methyltransferase [Desulfovibrio sp.]